MTAGSPQGRLEGEPQSLWVATAGTTGYPALRGDVEVDAAVVGGGIAGLTAALGLKRAGRTVALIEAGRIGTGVTGHTTGKVTSLHRLAFTEIAGRHGTDTARAYGQANQAGIEHIADMVAGEGIDCGFRRVANYTYAEGEDTLGAVRAEAGLAARLGLPAVFTTEVPLPFAVKGAVRFDGQAQIHAVKYLQGLARALDGKGSVVFEETRADRVRDGSPAVVSSRTGSIQARDIIVATNVPFGGLGLFGLRCHPHRSYLVAGRADTGPADATFISADEPARSILTAGVGGGSYVLVGGEGHRAAQAVDAAERYRRLAGFARDRLGVGEISYRWSTQDGIPLDGLPYVGRMSPAARHVFVITGLRKWGLSNGTAAAMILTDTLDGRANPWAPVFNSNRVTPVASARRFLQENVAIGSARLAGKRRRREPAAPELAPGDGKVFDINGESTAIYKDSTGQVRAVSAVCTHLGCTVAFNAADATWDCPCHGSRFATDGTVRQGPATQDLPARTLPWRG